MDWLTNLYNSIDSTTGYFILLIVATLVGLIARFASAKYKIPTTEIQNLADEVRDKAIAEIKEDVKEKLEELKADPEPELTPEPEVEVTVEKKEVKKPVKKAPAKTVAKPTEKVEAKPTKKTPSKGAVKKTKPPSIGAILILIFLGSLITACSVLEPVAKLVKDNVEVTWKADKAADTVPMDSIVVSFNPVYWKEVPDTTNNEKEKNFVRSGYSVWRLKTPVMTRYEVQKKDTVIYFYRKK